MAYCLTALYPTFQATITSEQQSPDLLVTNVIRITHPTQSFDPSLERSLVFFITQEADGPALHLELTGEHALSHVYLDPTNEQHAHIAFIPTQAITWSADDPAAAVAWFHEQLESSSDKVPVVTASEDPKEFGLLSEEISTYALGYAVNLINDCYQWSKTSPALDRFYHRNHRVNWSGGSPEIDSGTDGYFMSAEGYAAKYMREWREGELEFPLFHHMRIEWELHERAAGRKIKLKRQSTDAFRHAVPRPDLLELGQNHLWYKYLAPSDEMPPEPFWWSAAVISRFIEHHYLLAERACWAAQHLGLSDELLAQVTQARKSQWPDKHLAYHFSPQRARVMGNIEQWCDVVTIIRKLVMGTHLIPQPEDYDNRYAYRLGASCQLCLRIQKYVEGLAHK